MKVFRYFRLAPLIISIICFSRTASPQSFPLPESANYAESPMQKGLPEIEPGKNFRFKIKDPSFAWINPVAGLQRVYFIRGLNPSGKADCRILTVYASGDNTLSHVVVTSENGGDFSGYSLIETHLKNSCGFALRLYYSAKDHLLKYTWPAGTAGGNLEPVPFIKIGSNINAALLSFVNKRIKPGSLKNKTIILNWILATKGAGARSISQFNDLYKQYGNNKNLLFIAIGAGKNPADSAGNYYSFSADSSAMSFLGAAYPLNLILDSSGTVVYSKLGFNRSFSKNIDKILANHKKK